MDRNLLLLIDWDEQAVCFLFHRLHNYLHLMKCRQRLSPYNRKRSVTAKVSVTQEKKNSRLHHHFYPRTKPAPPTPKSAQTKLNKRKSSLFFSLCLSSAENILRD